MIHSQPAVIRKVRIEQPRYRSPVRLALDVAKVPSIGSPPFGHPSPSLGLLAP